MLLFPARGYRPVSAPPSGPSASLRRRKFRIAYFRLAAKKRSLRCASSPHKISDFAGTPLFPGRLAKQNLPYSAPAAVLGGAGFKSPPHQRAAKRAARKEEGRPRQGRKPLKTRMKGKDFPGSSGKKRPFLLDRPRPVFFSARRKENGGRKASPGRAVPKVPRPRGDEIPPAGTSKEEKG